ncbi:3D domain-containing protein [Deinococcus yunweiensis]|uniref:3D domain-containing protein n=1 Tax=Deinococcus yunweiensis TaxID=367282 RepID=UPI00398F6452
MSHVLLRWMTSIAFVMTALAGANPVLPDPSLASAAVQAALSVPQTVPAAAEAAKLRAAAVARTQAASRTVPSETVAYTPVRGKVAIVRATAYNSIPNQTDSTPFITATGTRTRPGVVALSRDLLRQFPYGSKIMIEDLSGRYSAQLKGRVFIVEDTMAARKTNSLDIWMTTRSEAMRFGARQVRITAVR